ncbi:MAG: hypothetical protein OIN88_02760 [Candidatus Methanoperedens sp.]|nr:hypothetical protein [Candidatus Methanoperedens sp.]MCZ7360755.1 hypothetical protein [Candidatus Methanoperedens sp.]
MNYILVLLWVISIVLLTMIPYSIALFYQRTFKRNTYPFLFLVSPALFIASLISYMYPSFFTGNVFFALGGAILGGASMRLHQVMTKRWK